jgi:hypothetical protein
VEEAKTLEEQQLSQTELIRQGTPEYLGGLMLKAKAAGNSQLIKQIRSEVDARIAYMNRHPEYLRGAFRPQLDKLINFKQAEEAVMPESPEVTPDNLLEAAHGE